jgi:hypothetical protein
MTILVHIQQSDGDTGSDGLENHDPLSLQPLACINFHLLGPTRVHVGGRNFNAEQKCNDGKIVLM